MYPRLASNAILAEDECELLILLPPLECWDYRCGHYAQFYHLPDIEPSTLNSVLQKIRQCYENKRKQNMAFKKEGETSGAFPDYPWRGQCLGLGLEALLSRP